MGYYVYCFEDECFQEKPTEAYVKVVEQMLSDHPELIGEFETYFTTDMARAEKYTGVTRYVEIAGQKVAIATGFGTAVKRKNLERIEKALYGEKKQAEDKDSRIGMDTVPEDELKAGNDAVEGHEIMEDADDDEIVYEDEDEAAAYEDEEDEDEIVYEDEDEAVAYEDEEDEDEIVYEDEDEEEISYEDEDDEEYVQVEDEDEDYLVSVQVWKRPFPRLKELKYKRLEDSVNIEKEKYKYKGELRERFVVKMDNVPLCSFAPDFEMNYVYRAWLYLDHVWVIASQIDYGNECFLCFVKVNGRKVERLTTGLGRISDAYVREDGQKELLFVNEENGEFVWYDLEKKACRHLNTETDCGERGYYFSEEKHMQRQYQGFRVFEDGSVLLNQEFLFDQSGEKTEIKDYLNCDQIVSACRRCYFEEHFLNDRRVPKDVGATTVSHVRYNPEKGVTIQIGESYPPSIEIMLNSGTIRYDGMEVISPKQENRPIQKVLEETELKKIFSEISKDFKTGYVAGGDGEITADYLYGEQFSEMLLACTCAQNRYLGLYMPANKMVGLYQIKWKQNEDEMKKFVSEFRAGKCYQLPEVDYFVSLQKLSDRYAIDESGFRVLRLVREGLSAFFLEKIEYDAQKVHNDEKVYDDEEVYIDHGKKKKAFYGDAFSDRIISCAGLLVGNSIFWTYPAVDAEGKAFRENDFHGAALIMDLRCLGYQKPMLVIYSNKKPNRIRICENKIFGSSRNQWWNSVRDTFTTLEIPGHATQKDADSIIPSTNPPAGVHFTGVNQGFNLAELSVTERMDDYFYSGDEIDPMKRIYQKQKLEVIFDSDQLKGAVQHPRYQNLRAGQFCEEGFLYATQDGAYIATTGGKVCRLTEGDNICGLEYDPKGREIWIYRFKGLTQYEFHEHYDILGGMSEEWRNSYHVQLDTERVSLDEVLRFLKILKNMQK